MAVFVIINQLRPSQPTENLEGVKPNVLPGTVFSIKGDRIWITFEGSSENWEAKREAGYYLRKSF